MTKHILICALLLASFALALDTDCNNPRTDLQEEYCTTRKLIDLYSRKLTVLEQVLGINSNSTHPPTSIPSPFPQNPSLYIRGNTFRGETVFVPPDKVINQGSFY